MNVAIYTRVSTIEQARSGMSLEFQEARCRAWAQGKGAQVVEVYCDDGYSAKDMKRPAFQEMLRDMVKGRFQAIAALKVDRLSRTARDFYSFLAQLEEFEVAVVAVTQDVDTSTPAGRLMRGMLLEFAQFEREMTAERVRETMLAAAKKGKWGGGGIPLGYRVEEKQLVLDPDKASVVREIFRLYLEGHASPAIAREIASRGHRIGKQGVLYVLRNPVYRGKIIWQRKTYQSTHDPIVDAATFDAAQKRLASRSNGPIDRNIAKRKYLYRLDGLIRCGQCGRHMSCSAGSGRGRRYFYYRCTTKDRGLECPQKPINAEKIEDLIIKELCALAGNSLLLKSATQDAAQRQEEGIAALTEQLAIARRDFHQAERRHGNLMQLATEGHISGGNQASWNDELERWTAVREKAAMRVDALADELEAMEKREDEEIDPAAFVKKVAEHLQLGDSEEQRQWLHTIIRRITITDDDLELWLWPMVRTVAKYG